MKKYYYVKCALDFIGALILLILLGWFIGLCMLIVKLDDPSSSAVFADTRVGKNRRVFRLYKLRTMQARYTGAEGVFDHALTGPGRILRKFSLDELPQLVNILGGTMSFIGPRPLPPRYLPYYTRTEDRRHLVRPGITGLAQVNGRANLNWDRRFRYDVEYVDGMSPGMDLKVILETVKKVICADNVMVTGDEVTESFDTYRMKQTKAEEA